MLKISAVYLIKKAEIPIHYKMWALVEQTLLMITLVYRKTVIVRYNLLQSAQWANFSVSV